MDKVTITIQQGEVIQQPDPADYAVSLAIYTEGVKTHTSVISGGAVSGRDLNYGVTQLIVALTTKFLDGGLTPAAIRSKFQDAVDDGVGIAAVIHAEKK